MLMSPPTAVIRVWMIGNSTKMLMLLPNIQNMNTVIKIWDFEAVATPNSFYVGIEVRSPACHGDGEARLMERWCQCWNQMGAAAAVPFAGQSNCVGQDEGQSTTLALVDYIIKRRRKEQCLAGLIPKSVCRDSTSQDIRERNSSGANDLDKTRILVQPVWRW